MEKGTVSKFNREGGSDLNSQNKLERIEEYEGEVGARKSLSDQLRESSKKKLQNFQKLTQEKNSFTRLSTSDLQHINKIKAEELEKLKELKETNKVPDSIVPVSNVDIIPEKISVPKTLSMRRKPGRKKSKALGIVPKRKVAK